MTMTRAPVARKVDELMERASAALAETRYFQAERLAAQALETARAGGDYERMARILLPLQEARRQRFQQAIDASEGEVVIVEVPVGEEERVEAGCYLFRPPVVGADARRFRLQALEQEVPVAALCREPRTLLRLCPIVAIAPGQTLRTRIDPPDDPEAPDLAWFVSALEQLGDFAIDSLDSELATLKRLNHLLDRLEILPEHERLHQEAAEACRAVQRELLEEEASGGSKRRRS